MTILLKSNADGSGTIELNGNNAITITSAGVVTLPTTSTLTLTTLSVTGNTTLGNATTDTTTINGITTITNGLTVTSTSTFNDNVNLGSSGTDTTTILSQLSANSSIGTAGNVLASRGTNLSPEWKTMYNFSQYVQLGSPPSPNVGLAIPGSVKRLIISFETVSTNGTSPIEVRINNLNSGYQGVATGFSSTGLASVQLSTGFLMTLASGNTAAASRIGRIVIENRDGDNQGSILFTSNMSSTTNNFNSITCGSINTSGGITSISFNTTNGVDVFDSGVFNIEYEYY